MLYSITVRSNYPKEAFVEKCMILFFLIILQTTKKFFIDVEYLILCAILY